MDTKNNNQRGELIAALNKIAARQLTQAQTHQFDNFIANAMHFYPDADYLARPAEDIFWNLWGLCRFSAEQVDAASAENRARVRVFNPDSERDGWSSAHTTIYINQRDMPFLVDSLRIVLNRRGLNIFTLQSNPVWVKRKAEGIVERLYSDFVEGAEKEALITIEVDLHLESELADLRRELLDVLDDVDVVVAEFDPMRRRVEALIEELQINAPEVEQLKESLEFLRWIYNGYFTFTGCVEFDLKNEGDKFYLSEAAGSRCGLLKNTAAIAVRAGSKSLVPVFERSMKATSCSP